MRDRRKVRLEAPQIEADPWLSRLRAATRHRIAPIRRVAAWALLVVLAVPLVALAVLGLLCDPPIPDWLDWTKRRLTAKLVSALLFLALLLVLLMALDH
jgi:hypothetical protein